MLIKEFTPNDFTMIYNNYMIYDFPAAELKPLDRILFTMSTGLCRCFGLFENETLYGYSIFITPPDSPYILLDYFAVVGDSRGKGIGSKFLSNLKQFFNETYPNVKGFFIECESIRTASTSEEESIRTRRISFYESNGCLPTLLGSNLFDVEYSICYYPLSNERVPNNDFDALNHIYKNMFKKHHYQNNVKIWTRLDERTLSMSAKELAPFLIGKMLCRNIDGTIKRYRITETECYCGEDDTACHASKGKTERTKTLYEYGGTAYVYLCYGIHNLFNVVAGKKGFPEAVLIRGIEGFDGPGKLTKALKINKSFNNINMITSDEIWLEDDGTKSKFRKDKRVGIDYATPKYRDILWRYILTK